MNKKETRGGAGRGAGAKQVYGEATTTVAYRIPLSKKEYINTLVKTYLNTLRQRNIKKNERSE